MFNLEKSFNLFKLRIKVSTARHLLHNTCTTIAFTIRRLKVSRFTPNCPRYNRIQNGVEFAPSEFVTHTFPLNVPASLCFCADFFLFFFFEFYFIFETCRPLRNVASIDKPLMVHWQTERMYAKWRVTQTAYVFVHVFSVLSPDCLPSKSPRGEEVAINTFEQVM